MVFGIGEGSMEIKLAKTDFAQGETAAGEVVLSLKQPKKARELRLLFYGEVKSTTHRNGKVHTSTRHIYEQKITLAPEGEFPAGTRSYPFEVRLPQLGGTSIEGGGIAGAVANIALNLANPMAGAKWYLEASLDVASSLDISKKMRINIHS
jgi:hypothetical protein